MTSRDTTTTNVRLETFTFGSLCFPLFLDADVAHDGVRLERVVHPVVGVVVVGHVDLEAAVFTQQNESRALIRAARVTDHNHVLDLLYARTKSAINCLKPKS